MNCPRCNTEYLKDDVFCSQCGFHLQSIDGKCPSCGHKLQPDDLFCSRCGAKAKYINTTVEVIESVAMSPRAKREGMVLEHQQLLNLSKTYEHNKLSPLSAPVYSSDDSPVKQKPSSDTSWLSVISNPVKAFYFSRLSRTGKQCQEILLTRDNTSFRWKDEEGKISISEEETVWNFVDHIYAILNHFTDIDKPYLIILDETQRKILNAIDNICNIQTLMGLEPAFARQSEIISYLKIDEDVRKQIKNLADKKMLRILGADTDEPLILMESLGQEMMRVLGESDEYFNLTMTDLDKNISPSFNLVARDKKLYLISFNKSKTIVRSLDKSGLRSLLNITWMAGS